MRKDLSKRMTQKATSKKRIFVFLIALAALNGIFLSGLFFENEVKAVGITYKEYTYELDGTSAVITAVDRSISGKVKIPEKFGVVSVASIGKEAFKNCGEITELTVPQSVKTVEEGAFSGCGKLEKVSFLSDKVSFGAGVFEDCKKLSDVTLPKNSEKISERMFSGCKSLEKIILPEGLSSIGAKAFFMTSLEEAVIPENVTVISEGAFSVSALKKVKLSAKLETIAADAFYGCSLTDVVISSNVKFIGTRAFGSCLLTGVIMTAMPQTVESGAFEKGPDEKKQLVFFGFEETAVKNFAEENGFLFANIGCRHSVENFEFVQREEPTCVKDGRQKGIFCGECKDFVCGAAIIPATGHKVVLNEEVPSTCSVRGSVGGKHCSVCGEIIEPGKPLPLGPHTAKAVVTKKATPSENGTSDEFCAVCGKFLGGKTIKKVNMIYLSKTTFTYNKKAHTPTVIVSDSTGKRLREGSDYSLGYSSGRTNTGKYSVTVTLKGEAYSGKKTLSFSVVPSKTAKLTVKVKSNTVAASWKKVPGADGYRVYLVRDKQFIKSADTKETEISFEKLSRGAKYRIIVRAFKTVKKEKLFSMYSTGETFITKPGTPVLIGAKASGKTVTVKWKEQKYVTGYVIYMAKDNGKFKKISVVKEASSYKITGLKSGAYRFKIKSFKKTSKKKAVYSDFGNVASVIVR